MQQETQERAAFLWWRESVGAVCCQALGRFSGIQTGASRSLSGKCGIGIKSMPVVVVHGASPWSRHEQHVAARLIQYVLGNAAQQPFIQCRAPMLANDDQIGSRTLCFPNHNGSRITMD